MNFTLIKSVTLFDKSWTGNEMIKMDADASFIEGQDASFYNPVNNQVTYFDTYGINWSPVPEVAWNKQQVTSNLSYLKNFKTAYLRFTVSVMNGTPGDSVLFIFNQPNTTENSRLHAYVHVEVAAEAPNTVVNTSKRISSQVAQVLIGNYNLAAYTDGNMALQQMIKWTSVRFLGVSKTDNVSVRCKCEFLGGITI